MSLRPSGLIAAGIAAGMVAFGAASVQAKEWKLTAGSSHPPIIPWVQVIRDHVVPESNRMLKEMGASDTIKWTQAYAGALYNFKNTLEGVGDGLADVGWVGTLWEPAKMPLQNVTFYAPFVTGNVHHLVEIQEELHQKIPAMAEAFSEAFQRSTAVAEAANFQGDALILLSLGQGGNEGLLLFGSFADFRAWSVGSWAQT